MIDGVLVLCVGLLQIALLAGSLLGLIWMAVYLQERKVNDLVSFLLSLPVLVIGYWLALALEATGYGILKT